jgi:hypothetical protein
MEQFTWKIWEMACHASFAIRAQYSPVYGIVAADINGDQKTFC